ncbi:MAG: YfjI family protein [Rhizobiaceae bacterium]
MKNLSLSPEQKLHQIGATQIPVPDIGQFNGHGVHALEGPQPLVREVPRGDPFPTEALGCLKEIVAAVHDRTQAPAAIAAQSALAVLSLGVQAFADVETLGGNSPCSLFALTIAQSGERKSACDKLLMQAVREHEVEALQEYKEQYRAYDTEHIIWETKRTRLMRDAAGSDVAKANSARADLDDLQREPEQPLSPNRTASDPTFEGLVKLFAIGKPSLGLFSDEGGSFVGGHAMNSDNKVKTCAGLSNLWDASPINRTRAGDGASTLIGRRLAAHIMLQPVLARPLLSDQIANSQGFLARFLICEPESTIGTRTRDKYNPASDYAIERFCKKLRNLLEMQPPLIEGSQNELAPRLMALSSEAKQLLREYYNHTEKQQAAGGEMMHVRPYASKSAEQAIRIAGVLSLGDDINAIEVNAANMSNGICLAQYYLSEAKRLVDAALISEKIARAEMLRKWLLDNCMDDYVLPRDILQKGPNTLRESEKMKEAVDVLKKHGWLVPMPANSIIRDRKRKEVYRIVRA